MSRPETAQECPVSIRLRHLKIFRSADRLAAAAACWLASGASALAIVQVDLSHSYTGATNPIQITGNVTLAFAVDGAGNVTLDASSADPDPAAYVNEFDGPVGTISDPAMWGQTFSIVLSSSGSGSLRLSNSGAGLSIQGGNAERLDFANESITATISAAGTDFKLLNLGYADATTTAGTQMNVAGTAYSLTGSSGSVDVSAQAIGATFIIDSTTDTDAQGFVLSGLSFDLVGLPLVASDTVVSFANTGTGFGPTPPFILSGSGSATITLAFSINNAGIISLNASTNSANATFAAMVNEWDRPNAGSVTNPSLFGKSFTLTGSATGGGGNLSISELGGGGIGIQGENSNRIDGLNYGTGDTTSSPETLTWTLSAPADLELIFKSCSFVEAAGGDIRVSNGTINSDFPNMTNATDTLDLPDLQLTHGGSLTFKEIPGIGSTTGAGVAGFTFSAQAPGTEGFDNGAGNNLWTNATNWNPDGVPAAPADAIINGYNVVLNSTAPSGPDELQIINGSLTLTGSGALSMRAMTIGRDLTKTVRLVIDGSGVSFANTGSSSSDEFVVGSAGTVETKPDSGGSEPLELGQAILVLDQGSEWILDGANYTGAFNVGDRFVLANFGSLSGSTAGLRTRNFAMPPDRRLELVVTSTSIYYEVMTQTAASGPNIIVINVDDMAGGQHFGFDGRDCLTPTLDTLASTGIRFTAAMAASTVCGPSRYALLTSRWPSRNTSENFTSLYPLGTLGRFGVSDTDLEHDGQNIGAWLKQAGYRTGFVGKSHVLDDDLKDTATWGAKGLITYGKTIDPAVDANVNAAMKHNHRVVCQMMREHGFDYVDGFYHANLKELYSDKLNVHNQEWITSRALRFIDENRNGRFFLYMAPTINHGPVNNNLDYTLRANKGYTSAGYLPNEDYSFMPTRQAIINEVNAAGKDLISARETWLDYSVKAITDRLTQYGIRNDTLIIFTSDHGEKTLYGPLVWGKSSLYDLGMKVPLVMNWPNGIASPGRTYGEIVSHVDIAPTLLSLAGASSLPTGPVDGVSLVPVFNGGSAPVRDDLFCEIGYARSVRTKTHKYIAVRYTPAIYSQIASGYRWPEYGANSQPTGGTIPRPYYVNNSGLGGGAAATNPTYFDDDQLYNLSTDPNEDTNLYGQDPALAYDLKKRLAQYIGDIPGRPFRQFSDSSTEFSPAPASAPLPPGALQMQFLGIHSVKLDWTDSAGSELGYVVRKAVNGGTPQIIAELPSGATTLTAALDPGVEDIVLQVASYNALGDSAVSEDLLAPESWRYRTFGSIDPTLSLPVSQWSNDADGDGVSTLWEYAYGTDPQLGTSVARPELRIGTGVGGPFLEYLLPRDRRRGLQFLGSVSSDLSTAWQSGSPHCIILEDEPNHLLFRSTTPMSGAERQFIRVEMVEPPGGQP
ncbi:MAG: sulfatase-like hydrolase/transferase [Akkermansiaceae bacterium]|jgi:arylsulfatase A-like enzyme|nr:sulfatase-like hydrolase/transferase [Akkermansiaceae bacterium]